MNFELKYSNKGDNEILYINFILESYDGNIKFIVGDYVEFSILECEDEEYKICKGGYDYLNRVEIEKDIKIFVEKLKKREFPCEFTYTYEYNHPFEEVRNEMKGICDGFKIIVNNDIINVNDRAFLPINNISIESIINFFEYLYEIRDKVQKENTYSDDEDDNDEYKDWVKKWEKEYNAKKNS